MAPAGFADLDRYSPTSRASYPAARSRAASSGPVTPLSAIRNVDAVQ